eukprot:1097702-Pleurochrysis_carterae.AAC.20
MPLHTPRTRYVQAVTLMSRAAQMVLCSAFTPLQLTSAIFTVSKAHLRRLLPVALFYPVRGLFGCLVLLPSSLLGAWNVPAKHSLAFIALAV